MSPSPHNNCHFHPKEHRWTYREGGRMHPSSAKCEGPGSTSKGSEVAGRWDPKTEFELPPSIPLPAFWSQPVLFFSKSLAKVSLNVASLIFTRYLGCCRSCKKIHKYTQRHQVNGRLKDFVFSSLGFHLFLRKSPKYRITHITWVPTSQEKTHVFPSGRKQ